MKELIKKLRNAANALEDLFGSNSISSLENEVTARKIRKDIKKSKKLHWTQTPKGKEIQHRNMKKLWKSGVFNEKNK